LKYIARISTLDKLKRPIVRRSLRFACACALTVFALSSKGNAQTNGTWLPDSDGNFSNAANWVGGVPGQGGVATFGSAFGMSGSRTVVVSNPTLSGLIFDSPWSYLLNSGTINLSAGSNFELRADHLQTLGPVSAFTDVHYITSVLAGNALGFRKTGNGKVRLNGVNSFTGNVSILGGELAVASDRAFGNLSNSITIDGGALNAEGITTSRAVIIGNQGGIIRFNDGTPVSTSGQFNGTLSGSGLLRVLGGGTFGFSGNGSAFTGPVRLESGLIRIDEAGILRGTNNFDIAGQFFINNASTNVANRISDSANFTLRGSDLFLQGLGSTEKFGTLTLAQGGNDITQSTINGNGFVFDSLVRQNRSTLLFRGTAGGLPSLDGNFIVVNNSPGTLVGGTSTKLSGPLAQIPILPFAHAISTSTATTGTYFVTWDSATGRMHFLADGFYLTSLASATGLDNVNLNASTTAPAGGTSMNALRLGSSFNNIVLSGGPLTINSGAILTSSSVFNSIDIDSPINFGNNSEGVLHVTSPLTISGAISGTNGLTRGGAASLALLGSNSYSGQTNLLSGTTTIRSDVLANTNGPLGNSNTAIVMHSGSNAQGNSADTKLLGAQSNVVIGRDISVIGGGSSTVAIGTNGSTKLTVNGNINVSNPNSSLNNGFLTLQGGTTSTSSVIINGIISGVGGIRNAVDSYFALGGNNTYSGGTILNGGTVEVASNTAFGTGAIHTKSANTTTPTIIATGGPRTIANDINLSTAINFAGTNPIVLAGNIAAKFAAGEFNVETTGAGVTIQGILSGTQLLKSGQGTLSLNNANTYTGSTVVRNGTLVIGGNALYGSGALGNYSNQTVGSAGTIQLGDASTQASNAIKFVTNGAYQIARSIRVNGFNSSGSTTLGGTNTSGVANYTGSIVLNRANTQLTSEAGGTVRYDGVISEAFAGAGINVIGNGNTDLTQANTFTGGVQVLGGKLSVNNTTGSATGSGQVSINSTATLAGNGTILSGSNGVVVNGTIAPGNSVGTLNFGTAAAPTNLFINGTYDFELTNAGVTTFLLNSGASSLAGGHDVINAFGNISFSGSTINLTSIGATGFDRNGSYSWLIAKSNAGTITDMPSIGFLTGNDFVQSNQLFSLGNVNGNLYLNYSITAVPEPSSLCAVSFVSLLSLWRLRRKKKAARA
jgi:autotransporter-associated beta strand protein